MCSFDWEWTELPLMMVYLRVEKRKTQCDDVFIKMTATYAKRKKVQLEKETYKKWMIRR